MRRRHGPPLLEEMNDRANEFVRNSVLEKLSRLDMYPKVREEVQVKTESGGLLSLVMSFFVVLLFLIELSGVFSSSFSDRLVVDDELNQKLRINLNITYFALHCGEVEMIVMDVAGDHQLDVHSTIHKHRIGENGEVVGEGIKATVNRGVVDESDEILEELPDDYCGSCYGAEFVREDGSTSCCNTCDEVKAAYKRKQWKSNDLAETAEQCIREKRFPQIAAHPGEGCMLEGYLLVNKVSGNFHVALGQTLSVNGRIIHQFDPDKVLDYNTTHRINHLSFGDVTVPGQEFPMDGMDNFVDPTKTSTAVYQYSIQIVPTMFISRSGARIHTNQFTFTQTVMPIGSPKRNNDGDDPPLQSLSVLPGTFFVYNISPFVVLRTAKSPTLVEFVTQFCAIIGGIVAISRILDKVLSTS